MRAQFTLFLSKFSYYVLTVVFVLLVAAHLFVCSSVINFV